MTFDVLVRYVWLPAMGTAAAFALFISLRQWWRDLRDGEW